MSNKRQATSDKRNQKGITMLIALFLFMLLSIFALNMAQMIAVDTASVATVAASNITGMGPRKELERLQAMYLTQAGVNHLYRKLVEVQRCAAEVGDPFCGDAAPVNLYSSVRNKDDPTNPTGIAAFWVSDSTGNVDPQHTVLSNPYLNLKAEGRVPDWANNTTQYGLEVDFLRTTRIFGSNMSFLTNNPRDMIDTSGTATGYIPFQSDPDLNTGIDLNMGTRSSPKTTPIGNGTNLGSSFNIGGCSGRPTTHSDPYAYCKVIIDFGMEVDFDEIRWLNRDGNYISGAEVNYWDSATGDWYDPNCCGNEYNSFPDPAVNAAFAPYYSGLSCANNNIYNGDRCTDFYDDNGNNILWEPFSSGDPCNLGGGGNKGCSVSTSYRSYIARLKLTTPVRTRRIELIFFAKTPSNTPFVFDELGVYCCGAYGTTYPPPANVRNVLKDLHGVVRTGVVYAYPGGASPPTLTYPNATLNSNYVPHEGDYHRQGKPLE